MKHHDDELPAMRAAAVEPGERQNERNLVQHALMTRAPEGAAAWAERYAERFGHLFDTDDVFSELIRRAHRDNDALLLIAIQERLDEGL